MLGDCFFVAIVSMVSSPLLYLLLAQSSWLVAVLPAADPYAYAVRGEVEAAFKNALGSVVAI